MKSLLHHEYVSIGSQNATHRIILLHGWGADANDLLPIGKSITQEIPTQFEIISLRAPNLSSHSNGREWYGLYPPNWVESEIAVDKLFESLQALDETQIPIKKTVLFGFSQGAAMALDVGLRLDIGLIIACSGYPHPGWMPKKNCSVLLSHGLHDVVVPPLASREILKKLKNETNSKCELYEFACSHEIHPSFINIVKSEIKNIF
tara:strand:- start:235 stop:849 length:615 start_codon:yes stop_codon:yes gene_type:complete